MAHILHVLMNRNIVNAGSNYQTAVTEASVVIIQLTTYLTVGTPGIRIQKCCRPGGIVFLRTVAVRSYFQTSLYQPVF